MTDPIGRDTYKGLAVPLFGESRLEQQNSSNAILTLMHSSANTGRFLMGIDYKEETEATSVLTDLIVFDIDDDGGFRAVSGTTVIMELNSSGLYQGSTKIIDTGGVFAGNLRQVVEAEATTGHSFASTDSGTLLLISSAVTTCLVKVPASAMNVGDFFDVVQNSTAAQDVNVVCTGSTGPNFLFHTGSTNVVATTKAAVSHASSGWFALRAIVISTSPVRYVIQNLLPMSGQLTTNAYYALIEGTSST